MPKQEEQQGIFLNPKESFNTTLWIVNCLTSCVYPFTRSGMGTNALGVEGAICFFALPTLASILHSQEMITFWYAWLAMVVFRKITADRHEHTKFQGNRWAARLLTLGMAKDHFGFVRLVEPLMVLGIALLIRGWSMPVAKLLMFSAGAIVMQDSIGAQMRRRRRDALHNARIEAGYYH